MSLLLAVDAPAAFRGWIAVYMREGRWGVLRNVAGQKITLFAFDAATGAPKTGDAANVTAYVSKDGGAVTALADTSATEASAANAPGDYVFDLSQAETDADSLRFTGTSSTGGVVVVPAGVQTVPQYLTALGINSSGHVSRVTLADALTTYTGNTPQTGDAFARIGAAGAGLTSLAPAATALSTATWTGPLAANLTTLAGHDPGATLGTSTLTQAQVTGGAYAFNASSFAFNAALDFTAAQKAATLARVTLVDTTTTNTDMRGTNNAALAATALSTAVWTAPPAGFLAATFPATVASPTNITAGTITTATNLTNLPAAPADWVSAASVSAAAVTKIAAGVVTDDPIASGPLNTLAADYAGGALAADLNGAVTGAVGGVAAGGITAASFAANAITASSLAADAVAEIQSGLSTYAGGDTAGTTTLLSRLTAPRAAYLDNLSAGPVALNSGVNVLYVAGYQITGQKTGTNFDLFFDNADTYLSGPVVGGVATAAAVAALPTAAQTAAAWGASVVGNGRTRDYFLQGGANKVAFAADGLSFTVYATDDATTLYTGTATRLATTVGGLRAIDPA